MLSTKVSTMHLILLFTNNKTLASFYLFIYD